MIDDISLGKAAELAEEMGVEIRIDPDTRVFKGGILEGKKVILVPEDYKEDDEDSLALELLHELGHIRYEHYGSGVDNPEVFVLNELQANAFALSEVGGYPKDEWSWSMLPGIAEDLAENFGLDLRDSWKITRKVAEKFGIGSSSVGMAEEDLRSRW